MPNEDWPGAGEYVRALRRRLGYTVASLAEVTHLSTRTINNLEHGHQPNFDDDTLAFVEAALGMSGGEIRDRASGKNPRHAHPEDLRMVMSAWLRLSDEDRRMIVQIARDRQRFGRR